MKRTLLFIACAITSITMLAQEEKNDYIPFVELGKTWHVESSPSYYQQYYQFLSFSMNEEVERDGKTYILVKRSEDNRTGVSDVGLFREENRRVYKYNEVENKEYMLYDFSLKEGDTIILEPESYFPGNYKVLKQGWLNDGPQVVSSINHISADSVDVVYRRLRTWTIGSETAPGKYREIATWVEGVGDLENTFCPFCLGGINSLAYVERKNDEGELANNYLPFSFYNMFGLVYGCNLPTGAVDHNSREKLHNLTYELEGNRLHVYGEVYTFHVPNHYAYFIQEATDDPLVRKLHFVIKTIDPLPDPLPGSDGKYLQTTNFFVSGFDPNINYIVVDDFGVETPVVNKTPQTDYRPFVEDGKVWKVGSTTGISDSIVKMVEYYYFDGDTIIDGKTFKQMMCQRYVNHNHPDYAVIVKYPLLRKVGAWYEEDKKVYFYNATSKQFRMKYDFSLNANDTLLIDNYYPYVIGPKQTGGLEDFKGVYRDVMWCTDRDPFYCTTWLEGVGGIDGPTINIYYGEEGRALFLMSCTVGDEVIYLNDEYEDGASPEAKGARKQRFDFTHTIKVQPKARNRKGAIQSLYGDYNDVHLGINLDPLDDSYLVRITDETGKTVYEKGINAGNIVALNIDISAYEKGRYTVTMENDQESFTGEFEAQTTGITEVVNSQEVQRSSIYNLQGQRISSLRKGLNIVNGRKVYVK